MSKQEYENVFKKMVPKMLPYITQIKRQNEIAPVTLFGSIHLSTKS